MTRGHTRTTDELKNIISSSGYIFIDVYVGNFRAKRIIYSDKDGYKYDSLPHLIKKNNFSPNPVDSRNRFSIENINIWLIYNKKNYECKSLFYKNAKTDLDLLCNNCNFIFHKNWDEIRNKNSICDNCSGHKATKTNNLAYLRLDLLKEWSYKNESSPHEQLINSNKKVIWICNVCRNEWEASINNRSRNNSGCPYCTGRLPSQTNNFELSSPDLLAEWNYKKNGSPREYTPKSPKKAFWKCEVCKHEWQAVISSRVYGRGCPKCKSSRGEKRVWRWLTENNISYIPQAKFDKCKDKRALLFDFYIPEYNLCIEYNGQQHYMVLPDKWFGGEKELIDRKRKDKIKKQFCKKNKIQLLIISYKDINIVENILKDIIL